MFYNTETKNHNLPFNPFKSCIVPRPIGWITSCNKQGNVNLAPYSYFNAVADEPPMIMFSCSAHVNGGLKDTIKNIEATKEFVVNIATFDLRNEVNLSSAEFPSDISEIDITKLATVPSEYVKPPRIARSPIHLECVHYQTVPLTITGDRLDQIVIGRVIGIHIDDNIIVDGKIDIIKFKPLARLGYAEYAVIENKFVMERVRMEKILQKEIP